MSIELKYQEALSSITSKLEETRKSKGLTQTEVAFACDMDEQNYRRVEKGETSPTLKTLVRLCEALELNLKDLF